MHSLPDGMLYEGVAVEVLFGGPWPIFGDLILLCGGGAHPRFPPSGLYGFDRLSDLRFTQVDDFFGVRSLAGDGDDVAVWLYPLVDDKAAPHHEGPYDGVRLSFNVLRNPVRFAQHYLRCVEAFSNFGRQVRYASRDTQFGTPPDFSVLRADIDAIVAYWATRGVEVGSEAALLIDY